MNALDLFAAARPDVAVDETTLDAIAADVFGGHRRRGGVRWRVLGVAALVAALVVGLIAAVGRPDPTGPAETVPPAIPGDGEPLALLPADPSPWRIMGSVSEPIADPVLSWSAVIARPDGTGGYDSPVIVRRGPSDSTLVRAGGLEGWMTVEPVELGNERQGELLTDQSAGRLIVQFELGGGSSVSVTTGYREPLSGERARAMQIASGIVFFEGDGADFGRLPDGYEMVAPWELGRVHAARWASFEMSGDGEWYTVNVVANPDPVFALRGMDDVVVPVGVRGTMGFLSTRRFVGRDDVQALTLVWQEQPGQWVRVNDVAPTTSQPDLLAFAESLRVVPVEAWDAVVERLPGTHQAAPATTAPVPVSDDPADDAAAVPPAGGTWRPRRSSSSATASHSAPPQS